MDAETLRLFGNVPIFEADRGEWLVRELENAGVAITCENRGQWLLIGNFGAFLPDWKPDAFFSRLKERAAACGKRVCFVGIGGLGASDGFWREVAGRWSGDFHFTHLGRRDAGEISRFLQSVDYGITTTPYFLVGKSGTCMAMLDHGLPILVPRIADEDDPTEFPADMVLRCGDEIGEAVFSRMGGSKPNPQLTRTADELIGAMSAVG